MAAEFAVCLAYAHCVEREGHKNGVKLSDEAGASTLLDALTLTPICMYVILEKMEKAVQIAAYKYGMREKVFLWVDWCIIQEMIFMIC